MALQMRGGNGMSSRRGSEVQQQGRTEQCAVRCVVQAKWKIRRGVAVAPSNHRTVKSQASG